MSCRFTKSTAIALGFSLGLASCATSPKEIYSTNVEKSSAPAETFLPSAPRSQNEKRRNYFDWPVDTARMTRGFLPNRKKPHLGLDLAAPKGTPVYAAHDGTIVYAGRDFRGYGRMVLIEGAQGWASLYAHFSKIQVREGQKVTQGQQIGTMGRSGRATGVHLHFELRKLKGPIDPLPYLPGGTQLASQ